MDFFRDLSISTSFSMCYNLLPHFTPAAQNHPDLMAFVAQALRDARIRTFHLSDRPALEPVISSLRLAGDILDAGGEPIVSLALDVYDRNTVLDKLQEYYQLGVRHFLFVSGNYPTEASKMRQKPLFDIDSVQLLMLLADLGAMKDIAKGCVVSPFKTFESEQVWQYEKLRRKIDKGADFVVTQLGYDIRKFDELVRYCGMYDITVPLMASVFITGMKTAKMLQARTVPGVRIPGTLLRTLNEEISGRQGAITRAAKILAALKGLGYHGALLGGLAPDFSETEQVLDKAETLQPDWQSHLEQLDFSGSANTFYYFQQDRQHGLNSSKRAPVALKHFPSPTYSFSYFVDWLVYVPQGPLFKLAGRFCYFCSTRKFWYAFLWLLEFVSKGILYGCKMCGDCTLYACGFLCYQSGCPKKMLNGPCGGSIDGYCEVFPGKKRCFWVKVYHNMKGVRQDVTFAASSIPARDVSLDRTSSWINFFMGRDHRKMKFKKESTKTT